MAERGWYPDPGGLPGRYRYWDGSNWSSQTTDNPRTPPPTPGPRPTRTSKRGPLLVAALIIAVIIALIGMLIVRSHRSALLLDPDPPESSVSGWDDSSPFPTASPSPSQSSGSPEPQGRVACTDGDPYATQPHPSDGRIHGGSLSILQPGGDWNRDDGYARAMTWAYDVAGADEYVEPRWLAMVAVGSLRSTNGFHSPRQSADGMMQCIASSVYYRYYTGRKDDFSKPFTLDGRTGWAMRSEVRVDDPQVHAAGDVVEVIVLTTDTPGRLTFFAGFVPIGDQNRLRVLDETIAGMRVD